jgi:hypothetical protein
MSEKEQEFWEIWYPKGAAAGLYFARCQVDPQETVFVHAAPPVMTIYVRDSQGNLKAGAQDLKATADTPMTRLTCAGEQVQREDIWPGPEDLGRIVILPGGEAGKLTHWWNASDQSEWRWQVEFYNHK